MKILNANNDTIDKLNNLSEKISYFFHANFTHVWANHPLLSESNSTIKHSHFLNLIEPGDNEKQLSSIENDYYNLICTKDGLLISPQEIVDLVSDFYLDQSFDKFVKIASFLQDAIKDEEQRVKFLLVSVMDKVLLRYNLEQNAFLKISTLQDFLMDYRNQRDTAYCDSEFFDNARKAFNAVPDQIDGYPSKNDINEFCKTAYLNYFIELNPFDSDADLSIEEFKCVFGDLTGFIQSQNEKELINRSIQSSEAPIRKRRL